MSQETHFLRGQAQRCRRLAASLTDTRTVNTMLQMAAEYEQQACALEQVSASPAQSEPA